jgi:hypothetical protein
MTTGQLNKSSSETIMGNFRRDLSNHFAYNHTDIITTITVLDRPFYVMYDLRCLCEESSVEFGQPLNLGVNRHIFTITIL